MRRISFFNRLEREGASELKHAGQVLAWAALLVAILVPLVLAGTSPLLAWRQPVYILAGFAGVAAMGLLLVQPLLAAARLPGLTGPRGRRAHRWVGTGLIAAVLIHVAGLWITSPPDVIDALLFSSPTAFSAWGVIALWAVFAAAILASLRRRLRLLPHRFRRLHTSLAAIVVIGSVVHASLIEGTMESISKSALCALVLAATLMAITDLRVWSARSGPR